MVDFENWIVDALKAHGGRASLLAVAEHIWANHKLELEADKKIFFTWQYRMRWAATKLRKTGVMKAADQLINKAWELN